MTTKRDDVRDHDIHKMKNYFIFPLLFQSQMPKKEWKKKTKYLYIRNSANAQCVQCVYGDAAQSLSSLLPNETETIIIDEAPFKVEFINTIHFESSPNSKLRNSGCDRTNWTWIEYLRERISFYLIQHSFRIESEFVLVVIVVVFVFHFKFKIPIVWIV